MMQLLTGLATSLVIIIYISIDVKHHDKNPWIWGIFALFFNFLALGMYLAQTGRKAFGIIWTVVWVVIEFINLLHGRLLL